MSVIFINRIPPPKEQPWGGGSKLLTALITALRAKGHDVVHELWPGLDALVCFDPRQGSDLNLVGFEKMHAYAKNASARPLLIQRVGDIGSHGKPELFDMVLNSVLRSDAVVFPSRWAFDAVKLALESMDGAVKKPWYVIPNAPAAAFYNHRVIRDELPEKLSFVTHHWSNNKCKGFEFYERLQSWAIENGHTFTFIGRAPEGSKIRVVAPMTEEQLAVELPKHHVYVTASLLEAGANHVIEGVAAGLPVIFHSDGGSIPEYCASFGHQFSGTIDSFEHALENVRVNIRLHGSYMRYAQPTIDDAARDYVNLIERMLSRRSEDQ